MGVETAKITIIWWSCTERNVRAQVVLPTFTEIAQPAGHTRLNRNSVT